MLWENCLLLRTDSVCGQISWHLFMPNGYYCLYIQKAQVELSILSEKTPENAKQNKIKIIITCPKNWHNIHHICRAWYNQAIDHKFQWLVVYEFFSCSTNIQRGLSAYNPSKLVVYCFYIIPVIQIFFQFFCGFTGTITQSWLTNQSACIDLVII